MLAVAGRACCRESRLSNLMCAKLLLSPLIGLRNSQLLLLGLLLPCLLLLSCPPLPNLLVPAERARLLGVWKSPIVASSPTITSYDSSLSAALLTAMTGDEVTVTPGGMR